MYLQIFRAIVAATAAVVSIAIKRMEGRENE